MEAVPEDDADRKDALDLEEDAGAEDSIGVDETTGAEDMAEEDDAAEESDTEEASVRSGAEAAGTEAISPSVQADKRAAVRQAVKSRNNHLRIIKNPF